MKAITKTPRLQICEAEVTDSKFILELLNSPNWLEFIGDRDVKTEKQANAYIKSSLIASYKQNGYGLYKMCLKESLHPIGICGFVKRDYLDHPDIGFAILPQFEGKGFTYEACIALLDYGKYHLKLDSILGITTMENIKSRNLLEKINLKQVGTVTPKKNQGEYLLFST
ncbi:GNAT family N-acetyltransferase [Flagellimonas onchidii]|uniref:GNAT family N-acetyltransferase n=1 Tax=Flagellimonas onchidii TaxID=2562684 RepID=UPI0010A5F877|nr:GNAT family N-acetyltransferase [Allomuricauda onchidii]